MKKLGSRRDQRAQANSTEGAREEWKNEGGSREGTSEGGSRRAGREVARRQAVDEGDWLQKGGRKDALGVGRSEK